MKDLICIDPTVGKLIGPYESGLLKEGERERFEIHLVGCTYCFNEVFQTQPMIANLRIKSAGAVTQITRERTSPKAPAPRGFLSLRDTRQWAGLALLFIMTMIGVCFYIDRGRPHIQNLRPSGPLKEAPHELFWSLEPFTNAFFEVEVFDDKDQLVHKGDTILQSYPLSDVLRRRFVNGKYTWRITGRPDNPSYGIMRESASFTISSPAPQPGQVIR